MDRYILYVGANFEHIVDSSNNKGKLIKECNSMSEPGTVTDELRGGIIHENKAQRIVNNS